MIRVCTSGLGMTVILWGLLLSAPAWADRVLQGFDENGTPAAPVTLPWVSPVTGDIHWDGWGNTNHYGNTGHGLDGVVGFHHTGEDWLVGSSSVLSVNQPIYAVNNGLVVWAGLHQRSTGFLVVIAHETQGNTMQIPSYQHPRWGPEQAVSASQTSKVYSYYLHLGSIDESIVDPDTPVVAGVNIARGGTNVSKGQTIGHLFPERQRYQISGRWVNATYVAHLHFEIWQRGTAPNDRDGYDPAGVFLNTAQDLAPGQAFLDANNARPYIHGTDVGAGGEVTLRTRDTGVARGQITATDIYGADAPVEILSWSANQVRFRSLQADPDEGLWVFLRSADGRDIRHPYGIPFQDIAEDSWFTEFVLQLFARGQVSGYTFDNFRPHAYASRAELLKLFLEAAGVDTVDRAVPFEDVPEGSWFREYVATALELRHPETGEPVLDAGRAEFEPGRLVNRAEAAKMATNIFGLSAPEDAAGDGDHSCVFSDVEGDDWFHPYFGAVCDAGLMRGYPDGTQRPGRPITRAEATKMSVIGGGL